MRAATLVVVLVAGLVGCAPDDAPTRQAREVHEIESRLFAPCCWMQTIDVHASPLADELRTEITTRVGAGEAARAIEDDLATRYGERIRAVPRDVSSRWLGAPFALAVLLGLVALGLMVRRLRRRAADPALTAPPSSARSRADEEREHRLEDELLEMD